MRGQHDVATFLSVQLAADAIREQFVNIPDVVHSSPLSRCAEPAALLAAAWGRRHRVDARLLEIHYGEWQGRAWADIERDDTERFADFMQHWQTATPPGGAALRSIEARVRAWRAELEPGDHLLVAYAGVLRALRVLTSGSSWPTVMEEAVPHIQLEQFSGAARDSS